MVNWDRLVTSTPVNKAAALARDGHAAEEWCVPAGKLNTTYSHTPLPTHRPHGLLPEDDLMGRVFGRLTVLGLSKDVKNSWVVRCACGAFETRKAKSLKSATSPDRCSACEYTRALVSGEIPSPEECKRLLAEAAATRAIARAELAKSLLAVEALPPSRATPTRRDPGQLSFTTRAERIAAGCTGKQSFLTYTEAERAVKGKMKALSPYRCRHCQSWHIGAGFRWSKPSIDARA